VDGAHERAQRIHLVPDEYSLLVRDIERDIVPVAQEYGLGILPYFPLASGLLTGKYRRNATMPEGRGSRPHSASRTAT
jgi:aryl-alcohol dehydrogenase-like predicted oxidoreductase